MDVVDRPRGATKSHLVKVGRTKNRVWTREAVGDGGMRLG